MIYIDVRFEVDEKVNYCQGCNAYIDRSDYDNRDYNFYCRLFNCDLNYKNEYGLPLEIDKCSDCLNYCKKYKQE